MAKSEISFDKKLDKNLGKRINQINKYKEFLKNQGSSVDKSYSEINEYLEKKLEQTYYFKQNNKTDSSIPKDNSDIKNAVKEYMGRTYIDKAPQNGELDKSFIKDLNKIYGKNYFKDNVLKEKESRQKYRDENNGKNRPIDIDGISEKINIPQAISSEKTNITNHDVTSHDEEKFLKDLDKQFANLKKAADTENAIKQSLRKVAKPQKTEDQSDVSKDNKLENGSQSKNGIHSANSYYYIDRHTSAPSVSSSFNISSKSRNYTSSSFNTFGGQSNNTTMSSHDSSTIDINYLNNIQRSKSYSAKDSTNRPNDKQKQLIERGNSTTNFYIAQKNKM